jgi:hypothetical protein
MPPPIPISRPSRQTACSVTGITVLFAWCLLAAAPAASAQTQPPTQEHVRGGMFDASDPASIQRFLNDHGYVASLVADADGDPVIRGRLSRTDYSIQFYECESGRFCNSVQFAAEAPAPPDLTLDRLNGFNQRWRYVRAVLVGDTIRLLFDLNLDAGVSAANLEDTLDIWRQLVEVFERDLARQP